MAAPTNYYFVATSGGDAGNDGRDLLGIGLFVGFWDVAGGTLSEVGAFASYTFIPGDRIYLSHADITDALYEIADKVDDNTILLVDEISAFDEEYVTSSSGPWAALGTADAAVSAGDAVFLAEMNDGEKFSISSTLTLSAAGDGTSGPIVWSGSNFQGSVDGTVVLLDYTGGGNTERVVHVTGGRTVFQYILVNGAITASPASVAGNGWEIDASPVVFNRCEGTNNDGNGFEISGSRHKFLECYAASNGTDGNSAQGMGFESNGTTSTQAIFFGCVAEDNENNGFIAGTGVIVQSIVFATAAGFHVDAGASVRLVISCTISNSGGDGVFRNTLAGSTSVQNNILIDNGGYGISGSVSPSLDNTLMSSNAFYNNSSGNINDAAYTHLAGSDGNELMEPGSRDIKGDPFVDASTGNFDLDIKKTPGLLCVASGTPRNLTGTTMTNSMDRGASFVEFVRHGTG